MLPLPAKLLEKIDKPGKKWVSVALLSLLSPDFGKFIVQLCVCAFL